jgi:hypothetical protein
MGEVFVITVDIAALAAFLIFVSAAGYAVPDTFSRSRLIMTAFFIFIVCTLTVSFWRYTLPSVWFSLPALILGMLAGHFIGVKAAKERLMLEGAERYMAHAFHVHFGDMERLEWWSLINFYTIAGALVLVNVMGLSTVFFAGREGWALASCAIGALLIGTIAPYLVHLWSISARQNTASTTREM